MKEYNYIKGGLSLSMYVIGKVLNSVMHMTGKEAHRYSEIEN